MELPDELLRGIYSYGFEKPSAIQQRAIKPAMLGKDLIAQAQSGTVGFNFCGANLFLIDCVNLFYTIEIIRHTSTWYLTHAWIAGIKYIKRDDDQSVNTHLSSLNTKCD